MKRTRRAWSPTDGTVFLGLILGAILVAHPAKATNPLATVEDKIKYIQDFFWHLDQASELDYYLDAVGVKYVPATSEFEEVYDALYKQGKFKRPLSDSIVGTQKSFGKPFKWKGREFESTVLWRRYIPGEPTDYFVEGKWHELTHLAQDWAGYVEPEFVEEVEAHCVDALERNERLWRGELREIHRWEEKRYRSQCLEELTNKKKSLNSAIDGLVDSLAADGTIGNGSKMLDFARRAGSRARNSMLAVGDNICRVPAGRFVSSVGIGILIDYGITHAVYAMGGNEGIAQASALTGGVVGQAAVEHFVFGAGWKEAFGISTYIKPDMAAKASLWSKAWTGTGKYKGLARGTTVAGLGTVIMAGIQLNMLAYEVRSAIYARINDPNFDGFTPQERDAWLAHPSSGWQYAKDATAGYWRALGRTYGWYSD